MADLVAQGIDYLANLDLNLSGTVAKLLLALFLGFPFAFIHRVVLNSETTRHLFSIISGFSLLYWVFGDNVIHPVISFAFTYIVVSLLPPRVAVVIVFIESICHLNYLYWLNYTTDFSETLDADVSGPQCIVLCKCISFAFDYYDGSRLHKATSASKDPANDKAILSPTQMTRQLSRLPTILEYAGYCFFPIGIMVGPYFSIRHYLLFTNRGLYSATNGVVPPTIPTIINRLAWCAFHALVFHFVGDLFPINHVLEPDFTAQSWIYKITYMTISFRVHLFKYVIIWFIVESTAIFAGIGMSGYDDKMVPQWDAFQNIEPLRLMFAYNYATIVRVWHCKANDFIMNYIFKRVPGRNRYVNLLIAMLFLASWHGLYIGYFITFLFEYVLLFAEGFVGMVVERLFPGAPASVPAPIRYIGYLLFFILTVTSWTTALVPFFFLTWERILPIWSTINHAGVIGCIATIIISGVLLSVVKPKRNPKKQA